MSYSVVILRRAQKELAGLPLDTYNRVCEALRGQRIRQGQKVTIWEMSANRDEDEFADPFRFDIGRNPNFHVGFGLGTHFCLGANLARLEVRVVFEELLARYEGFEIVGDLEWTNNNRLVGLTRLPLRVTSKAAA